MFLSLSLISDFLRYISRAAQCRECLNSQNKMITKENEEINKPMTSIHVAIKLFIRLMISLLFQQE